MLFRDQRDAINGNKGSLKRVIHRLFGVFTAPKDLTNSYIYYRLGLHRSVQHPTPNISMNYSFFFKTDASILCLLLFIGCLFMVGVGKFCRSRFFHQDQQESKGGVNSLLGALFGLWGFLLAFTFSNSSSKFENVRSVTVEESNVIRNTILRTDLFPDSIRIALRQDLKLYLEAEIDYYRYAKDFDKFLKAKETSAEAEKRLWEKTVRASQQFPGPGAGMQASLLGMFDIGERRNAFLLSGVPELVVYMLFFLALAISFIGGFTTPVIKVKEWVVIIGFLLLACIIIYITLDLGRPLRGFIQLKTGKDRLIELRKMF